jgi:hypothetical protein
MQTFHQQIPPDLAMIMAWFRIAFNADSGRRNRPFAPHMDDFTFLRRRCWRQDFLSCSANATEATQLRKTLRQCNKIEKIRVKRLNTLVERLF